VGRTAASIGGPDCCNGDIVGVLDIEFGPVVLWFATGPSGKNVWPIHHQAIHLGFIGLHGVGAAAVVVDVPDILSSESSLSLLVSCGSMSLDSSSLFTCGSMSMELSLLSSCGSESMEVVACGIVPAVVCSCGLVVSVELCCWINSRMNSIWLKDLVALFLNQIFLLAFSFAECQCNGGSILG